MKRYLRNFLESFKDIMILKVLFVDAVFFLGMYLITVGFFGYVQAKSLAITQGYPLQQIQQLLLNAPEKAADILASLQGVLVFFLVGFIVLIIAYVLLFSYSRAFIWNMLRGKKFSMKRYWRWNAVNVILFVLFVIYLIAFSMVKFITSAFLRNIHSPVVSVVVDGTITLSLLGIFMLFTFLVYYTFVERYKVWESVGNAFHLIGAKWSQLWKVFLLSIFVMGVVNLLLYGFGSAVVFLPRTFALLSFVAMLLTIAWMRVYVVRVLRE